MNEYCIQIIEQELTAGRVLSRQVEYHPEITAGIAAEDPAPYPGKLTMAEAEAIELKKHQDKQTHTEAG